MTSIVMSVLKATIGKLMDKGRKMAVEKLKEGDVTDEQFRRLIVSEIEDITSKLDGLARANLLASISFFKEGLFFLYKVLDLIKAREESGNVTAQRAEAIDREVSLHSSAASVKAVSLAEEMKQMKSLQLTDQNDPATRALSDAKGRFTDARRKSTEAFSNEALSTCDRILAMQFRVMATLLEKVENPADALVACRVCLEELHAMPAVRESFNVQLKQGFKSLFRRAERQEIVNSVCRLNRVIYDVAQMAGEHMTLLLWPCIDTGEEKVDPLRDSRVVESLRKLDMEQFCVTPWSLGQDDDEEEHKLKSPCVLTTNIQGQLLVMDKADSDVKVFSSSGKYLESLTTFTLSLVDSNTDLFDLPWKAMATDKDDNVYLMVNTWINTTLFQGIVYVFDNYTNLQNRFTLKENAIGHSFVVNDNNKLFVAVRKSDVQVYDTEGHFLHSFGSGILKDAAHISPVSNGCVMVLDSDSENRNYLVHVFSEMGDHLSQFKVAIPMPYKPSFVAFHRAGEQVVVLSVEPDRLDLLDVWSSILSIYSKDGVFVRKIHLNTGRVIAESGLAVTKEGYVAMCVCDSIGRKIIVV